MPNSVKLISVLVLLTGILWQAPKQALGQPSSYDSLLSNPRIAASMIWYQDGSTQAASYPDWSPAQQTVFADILAGMDAGDPFPLVEPPELLQSGNISRDDAWTLYALSIAHSLWVESEKKVGWSILDLGDEELRLLYDGTRMYTCGSAECASDYGTFGRVTDWNSRYSYDFLLDNGMIGETQLETVLAFTYWGRRNLIHISGPDDNFDGRLEQYGYGGDPPVDKVLSPLPDRKHITAGCWGTSGVFNAVMRSVNIPVQTTMTHFGYPGNDVRARHSRFEFPTLGIGLTHGDDIYNSWLKPFKSNNVHSTFLFHPLDWLRDHLDDPVALDCNRDFCNTPEDQALFNTYRHALQVAAQYFSNQLLRFRLDEGSSETVVPESFRSQLTGLAAGNEILEYAHPFFTDSEIDDIAASVDDEIRRIGGGSWEEGAQLILFGPDDVAMVEPDISDYRPLASFTAVPAGAAALEPVQFEDYSFGQISGYHWDFGDGVTSAEPEPIHTFAFADSFPVTLTVSGPTGSTTGRRTILITAVEGVAVPDNMVLLGPVDSARGISLTATFEWEKHPTAAAYDLQVATDGDFLELAYEARRLTEARVNAQGLAEGTGYYWRVRGLNEGGAGSWSSALYFQTGTAPTEVVLTTPANETDGQPTTTTFSWESQLVADHYHLQISRDEGFSQLLVEDSSLTQTSYQAGPFEYSTTLYWRVRALNSFGTGPWSEVFSFTTAVGTEVEGEPIIPHEFALHQNYPNPFNPSTTIRYDIPLSADVNLAVYDALGRLVETLVAGHRPAGRHLATWEAARMPTGIYIVRVTAGPFNASSRMLLLR